MIPKFNRRKALSAVAALGLMAGVGGSAIAQDLVQLRLSMAGSETDQRSVAMAEVFGPAVSEFASYEPSYNATLFAQGTELEAISRGNLDHVHRLGAGIGAVLPGILDLHRGLRAPGRRPPGRGLQRPPDGPVQAEGDRRAGREAFCR
jgi:2-phosphoglycerate kinase